MNPTQKKDPSQLKVSVHPRKSENDELDETVLDDDPAGSGNLDKVRDILFGAQSREYEKRFTRLEERLLKEAAELRNDLKGHFDSLEMYVKKEVESLTGRMKNEQREKSEAMKSLGHELGDLGKQIQSRITQLDDQAIQGQRDLRQQVLDQHKNLSQEIQQKNANLAAMLEKTIEELRGEKLDRASLAEMFMESALRLNNDFKLPSKE
ncbi:MAG: hypothetical protein ACPGYT_05555 [Nitrospirales bacterium]